MEEIIENKIHDQKPEFENESDIAFQQKLFDKMGAKFCRKLQGQIEDLLTWRINQKINEANKMIEGLKEGM